MLKGYYIHFKADRWISVSKKIQMQMAEFQKHFDIEEISVPYQKRSVLRRVYDIIPFTMSNKYNFEEVYSKIESPDFLYVRAVWADNQYMDFFKRIKEKYPDCKIIVEIPTYPYDKEVQKCLYPRDLWSRRKYRKYVDRIVTFSPDEIIFHVPTIRTMNGIVVDDIRMIEKEKTDEKINLVAAALMFPAHGYERVIRGLANYKRRDGKNIVFHLVGDGPEKKEYIQLAEELDVNDVVKFYPMMNKAELDDLYEIADIALDVFGVYKKNISVISSLKSREALAKGLPLMAGCKIDVCEKKYFPYVLEFPNDASDLDMFRVEEFYKKIRLNKSRMELAKEIRQYAKDNLDMAITMKPIIDYIENESNVAISRAGI